MIRAPHEASRILNLSLSALHLIAAETGSSVPYILGLLNEPRRADAPGAQTGGMQSSPAGSDAVAIPATHSHAPDAPAIAGEDVTAAAPASYSPIPQHDVADDADGNPEVLSASDIPENAPAPAQAEEGDALVSAPIPDQDQTPPSPKPAGPVAEPTGSDQTGEVVPSASPVPKARRGTLVARVVACHEAHPDFTARQIAEELGLDTQRVAVIVWQKRLPVRKVTAEENSEAHRKAKPAEPTEARQPAAVPPRQPEPATPPASKPAAKAQPSIPTGRSSPSVIIEKPITKPKGTRFRLIDGAGLYLHWSATMMTSDKKQAWDGSQDQLAGCRRKFPMARDLIEQAIEKDAAR